MTDETNKTQFDRIQSGVPGLDEILCVGLLPQAVYIVQAGPGEGKTILANQFCQNHAKLGKRALYVTLLAETHNRLLRHLRKIDFMADAGDAPSVFYESAFDTLRQNGPGGVLRFLTRYANWAIVGNILLLRYAELEPMLHRQGRGENTDG